MLELRSPGKYPTTVKSQYRRPPYSSKLPFLNREYQMLYLIVCLLVGLQSNPPQPDPGLFPKALWFLHAYGQPECSIAKNDQHVKKILAKSFAKDRELSLEEASSLVSPEVFRQFAGEDDRLSESEITSALAAAEPPSRQRLLPELRQHADLLATTFDMIEPAHFASMDQLADWIVKNWQPHQSLHILSTCTGNSRRSILGATMGNLAATYYGFDNIRFHSGGTTPSAFNKRTIATLKEIGFQIEPTGEEGERGEPTLPNPKFRVVWGKEMEAIEFSKSYRDSSNPQSGFAAVLVCNEADADCPVVAGASLRISMTFLDPKSYDDGAFESMKYAERRDDIGRTFLAVMANARRKIQDRDSKK